MERYRLAMKMKQELEEYILSTQLKCQTIIDNETNMIEQQLECQSEMEELENDIQILEDRITLKNMKIELLNKQIAQLNMQMELQNECIEAYSKQEEKLRQQIKKQGEEIHSYKQKFQNETIPTQEQQRVQQLERRLTLQSNLSNNLTKEKLQQSDYIEEHLKREERLIQQTEKQKDEIYFYKRKLKLESQDHSSINGQLVAQISRLKKETNKLNHKIQSLINENEQQMQKITQLQFEQQQQQQQQQQQYETSTPIVNNVISVVADHENDEEKQATQPSALTDAISVATTVTGITGVSSIATSITMDDPLIVMMGVGEYDGMPNLDGIARDYDNIINTFVNEWKYKIFYKLNDNTSIYTNNTDEIKANYKLKWDSNDIDEFVKEARMHLVQNRHNGLIFAISSHGDREKMMYDSECEKYSLNGLFSMYSPAASGMVEYQETEEETNLLFTIPKIFFLDMCRGDGKAKVTNVTNDKEESESKQEKKSENNSKTGGDKNSISLHETDAKKDETFQMKRIGKEQASTLVAQMANFCMVYTNVERFSVGDGAVNGAIFLKNVCKVFKDTKFVSKHKWTDLIFKIREYTKRDATLMRNLFNFTQLVESEGTLERVVIFGSKHANIIPSLDALDEMKH